MPRRTSDRKCEVDIEDRPPIRASLRGKTRSAAVRAAQRHFRSLAPESEIWSDEWIAERRSEAKRPRRRKPPPFCGPANGNRPTRPRTEMRAAVEAKLAAAPFDIDVVADEDFAIPSLTRPALTLDDIGQVLSRPDLRPAALEFRPLDPGTYAVKLPGMPQEIRATTVPEIFEYSENHEFLSPGGSVFDRIAAVAPEFQAEAAGPGVAWLVTAPDGGRQVVVMTADGALPAASLGDLLDALQRAAQPAEFPADRFPGAQARLLA